MRGFVVIGLFLLLISCKDENRIYDRYHDFDDRVWVVTDTPTFEFEVADNELEYTIMGHLRNAVSYPWSRIFVQYDLQDSVGNTLKESLTMHYLFDAKSGKPQGSTGIGDIFDHEVILLDGYKFPYKGRYVVKFEQRMRVDSLEGMLAVGLRVEKQRQSIQ
jgi:gliding motility-associated lipoprotein GldH